MNDIKNSQINKIELENQVHINKAILAIETYFMHYPDDRLSLNELYAVYLDCVNDGDNKLKIFEFENAINVLNLKTDENGKYYSV